MNPVDQLRPDARLGDKAKMPTQLFELSAHRPADLATVRQHGLDLVDREQSVWKEPAGITIGKGYGLEAAGLGKLIEMLPQEAYDIIGGGAALGIGTKLLAANKFEKIDCVFAGGVLRKRA